ncbi:hypothetical protein LSG31_18220 [Fodinisporobacter ferrooxydans]|uniref:Uncharacterized protein n=1 Tax=Fodinisporobacter ferrooxydans TaxID=2901836 RepID=A0ABY4CHL9_9BACL|nr:hypothetical protein LSG31_18220 [Alicyclobacillaceae bacterium MYW30-H2]
MEWQADDFIVVRGANLKLELGDLIFVRRARWIQWLTKSKYQYVSMYIGCGRVLEAQWLQNLCYRFLSAYKEEYDVYRYNDVLNDFQKGRILFFLRSYIRNPFDTSNVFARFFYYMLRQKKSYRFLCARFVRDAYTFAGLTMPEDEVLPEDLAGSEYFHQVN